MANTGSKHAAFGITKSASHIYAGSGVRVNAVAPGPVRTDIEARFDSELGHESATAVLPTPVGPVHLAASITFLLSDDAVEPHRDDPAL